MKLTREQLEEIVSERGIDIDNLKEVVTDEEAIDRFEQFIKVGRRGWADPMLQASLERVFDMVSKNRG